VIRETIQDRGLGREALPDRPGCDLHAAASSGAAAQPHPRTRAGLAHIGATRVTFESVLPSAGGVAFPPATRPEGLVAPSDDDAGVAGQRGELTPRGPRASSVGRVVKCRVVGRAANSRLSRDVRRTRLDRGEVGSGDPVQHEVGAMPVFDAGDRA
jgi:hypothetical protein